jgi:copper(I)-binding protein
MLCALALMALPLTVAAHHPGDEGVRVGDIRVGHAWAEEPTAMQHSLPVWLTIENLGTEPDELIAAHTPVAQRAVIQGLVVDASGRASVREFAQLAIEPGQTISLAPGGLSLVLHGLRLEELPSAGDHFDLTLVFARAGAVTIEVEVEERRGLPAS